MNVFRIFTGADGKSHIERLNEDHDFLTERLSVSKFFLKRFPVGTVIEKHPAPRKMITIIVEGRLELSFDDGSTQEFSVGDVRFMEDTDSEGHVTRVVGEQDVVIAVISNPELTAE